MIVPILTVFVASLVGSLHCVGMCGPFVAFAIGAGENGSAINWRLAWVYHLGRLLTYAALGAVSGALGAAIDLGGREAGFANAAAIAAGAVMIAFGVTSLLKIKGVRVPGADGPAPVKKALFVAQRAAMKLQPAPRAFTIGLLTTLLPCGWLYAFVAMAAGTASPVVGAATMATFWFGTLPALVALGVGLQKITGAFAARLPAVSAVVLVIVGLLTIGNRLALASAEAPACEHHPVMTAQSINATHTQTEDCCPAPGVPENHAP
jgi:sulfite exporter TauE/SafE